jgi:hypothetical protein
LSASKDSVKAQLKDTYWKLVELNGTKVTMAPTQQREVRITLDSEGSRVFGFSGCTSLPVRIFMMVVPFGSRRWLAPGWRVCHRSWNSKAR